MLSIFFNTLILLNELCYIRHSAEIQMAFQISIDSIDIGFYGIKGIMVFHREKYFSIVVMATKCDEAMWRT